MYRILVPKAVSDEPIECEKFVVTDKGVEFFQHGLRATPSGFIPHGNFGAILPVVEAAEPGTNTIKL
jgi:hypothetical protein